MNHLKTNGFGGFFVLVLLTLLSPFSLSYGEARDNASRPNFNLPQNFWRLSSPVSAEAMPFEVLDSNPEAVRLEFSDPPLEFGFAQLNGVDYSTIRLNGEGSTHRDGEPDLPRVSKMVMIGNHGQIALRVVSQNYRTESLDHLPLPYQSLQAVNPNLDEAEAFAFNAEVYSRDSWYPENIAEVSAPTRLRDVRFAVVAVYPVQINPVTREMRIYDQIEVAVENIGGIGESELPITPTSLTPGFKKLYRAFENFDQSALDALPVVPGKQLFICNNNATVLLQVQRLVDWRRRKGIDATLVTTSVTGSTESAIKTYITNQYTASNGQLEFVTLVGDPNGSGAYAFTTRSSDDQWDHYFGSLDGGPNTDPLVDIAIGRIPANNSTQLSTMVQKILDYESDPFVADTTWFTRGWCATHTLFINSNPSTKEYTRQIMLQHGLNSVSFDVFAAGVNAPTLNTRLNQGVCVFNHRMSSNLEMTTDDMTGFANGRKLPFVMAISCQYGTFDQFGNVNEVAEEWVRMGTVANQRGAIGCVGMHGTSTHVIENNILDGGAMMGLFAQDIREQGIVLISGELQLFKNLWDFDSDQVYNFIHWANLFGDPGVPIWLSVPRTPAVTKPATLNLGTNHVTISVTQGGNPVEGALIGLVKGVETFSRGYTNAAGSINLPITTATTGYLYVTVTRENLDSYLDSIQVVNTAQSLSFFSNTIDDDNSGGTTGDGNFVLNPGETVDLNIRLTNSGTSTTVTGISAVLTAGIPGVTIISGAQSYPDIAVGANAVSLAPFRIQVGAVYNNEPIQFYLNTTSSAGTQSVRLDLTPSAADVEFSSSAFLDGNAQLDAGDTGNLTVTMTNSGSRNLVSANAILRSMDTHVLVNDSVGAYGNVNSGASATNSGNPFNVTASPQTVGGYPARMQLIITDSNGLRDSVNFNLNVGIVSAQTGTGPDAYGYYAFDNTETLPGGSAANYQWVEICPALGGAGTRLGLEDNGADLDQTITTALPFNFTFYGNTFNQISVCSNGWIAFGDEDNTDFRNYRMGYALGPQNQVAAYWNDLIVSGFTNAGVYVRHDAVNERYIIEWISRTLWTDVNEVFQIILLNPSAYPSASGNGKILVQYQNVTPDANLDPAPVDNAPYATVGIQNSDHTVGLEYSFINTYPPSASPLQNGRAIMYTTDLSGTLFTTLTVGSPNGGESWFVDSTVTISWFTANVSGNVSIEISRSGLSGPWTMISASTPNDGLHGWTVQGPASADCRLRIISLTNPNEADTCDAAFGIASVQNILLETFESGAANWTHGSAGGSWIDQWHISTERALGGTHSYKCGDTGAGDYSVLNDARLNTPVVNNLPAGAKVSFSYQIETEISGAFPDSAYDGGILEVSLNGGAFQEIAPIEGYPKTFRWEKGGGLPASGPMRGQPCWGGSVTTWTESTVDLAAYEGQNIQLRFRFGSDSLNTREGWYLDNVRIYSPSFESGPTIPQQVTVYVSGADLILRWNTDGNPFYKIFSSDVSDGTFTTQIGTSNTNSFTVVNGALEVKKFYVVVGWDGN